MQSQVGVGLRSAHYPYLIEHRPLHVDFFEIISENYMDSLGRPREILRQIRRDFPIAMHGVSMNLGSCEGLREDYLKRLKSLIDEVDPFIVSDHLCWTGFLKGNTHDLLPLPYTKECLNTVLENLDRAQNALGRSVFLENASAYVQFEQNDYDEAAFLTELAQRAGTKLLLDLNNVYVNSQNFEFCPKAFVGQIPSDLIGQIHLAGFTDMGDFLFDTHSKPVFGPVWELLSHVAERAQKVPILIEWDDNIPEFLVLEQEAVKARAIMQQKRQVEHVQIHV